MTDLWSSLTKMASSIHEHGEASLCYVAGFQRKYLICVKHPLSYTCIRKHIFIKNNMMNKSMKYEPFLIINYMYIKICHYQKKGIIFP
jgi:hypothetical protein